MNSFERWVSSAVLLLASGCASEVSSGDDDGDEGSGGSVGATEPTAPTGSGGADEASTTSVTTGSGATSTATTSAQTTTGGGGDGGAGTGGQGGGAEGGGTPASEVCQRTEQISLGSIFLDVDAWGPGESAMVMATLESAVDHFDYPGVRILSDHPYVTADPVENFLFGLVAGEPVAVGVQFTAADFVDPGTVVSFSVEVITLVEPCEGLDRDTFAATIE